MTSFTTETVFGSSTRTFAVTPSPAAYLTGATTTFFWIGWVLAGARPIRIQRITISCAALASFSIHRAAGITVGGTAFTAVTPQAYNRDQAVPVTLATSSYNPLGTASITATAIQEPIAMGSGTAGFDKVFNFCDGTTPSLLIPATWYCLLRSETAAAGGYFTVVYREEPI